MSERRFRGQVSSSPRPRAEVARERPHRALFGSAPVRNVVGEMVPPSTRAPAIMDAGKPTPPSGENVSDASTVSEYALQQTLEGQTGLFRDYASQFQKSVRESRDGLDRAELLEEIARLESELQVMRTLLEEYPEAEE